MSRLDVLFESGQQIRAFAELAQVLDAREHYVHAVGVRIPARSPGSRSVCAIWLYGAKRISNFALSGPAPKRDDRAQRLRGEGGGDCKSERGSSGVDRHDLIQHSIRVMAPYSLDGMYPEPFQNRPLTCMARTSVWVVPYSHEDTQSPLLLFPALLAAIDSSAVKHPHSRTTG